MQRQSLVAVNFGARLLGVAPLPQTDHVLDVLSKCHTLFRDQLCVELRHYGGTVAQLENWLGRRRPMVVYRPQQGEDLGEKMANAIQDAISEGAESVVVVSTEHSSIPRVLALLS